MGNKIEIAGLCLDNCTTEESLRILEEAAKAHTFFSIAEVDIDTVYRAGADADVRSALERLNHTVITEPLLLKAANQESAQRQSEIAERSFFRGLMGRIVDNHITVCLLGETERQTFAARDFLLQEFPGLEIVDVEILEQCTGELDNIVNEMNTKTPEVIISLLPAAGQAQFFAGYRDKLSAGLWYGMKPLAVKRTGIFPFFRDRKRLQKLLKYMEKYQKQETANNEGFV